MSTCVIFNPTAKGDKARRFRARLDAIAGSIALKPTTRAGEGRLLAREAVEGGFETLIAAGGDGTINEVVNGIGDTPEGFKRARLAVLPLGTANVFARELGLPFRLREDWKIILEGKEALVDLVQARYGPPKQPQTRYLVQLGGAGLDARAIELLDYRKKRYFGYLAYVLAGLNALKERKPVVVVAGDGQQELEGEFVLVGNGRRYGGAFTLFPYADLKDGRLDVTVFPTANFRTLWRATIDMLTGQWEGIGGSVHVQGRSFTLKSSDHRRIPFEIDGDNAGHLPVTFKCLPKTLRVVC